MIKDRIAFDLPDYDGLLAGHYLRGPGYGRRRDGGTDDWLMILTLAGRGRIGNQAAEKGSVFLIGPGVTHDYGTARFADEWEILWVHFHPRSEWIDLLKWPVIANGVYRLEPEHLEPIQDAFEEVIRLSNTSEVRSRQFAMNGLERLLLLCDQQLPSTDRRIDDRIRASIDYIQSHLRDPINLDNLSDTVHLSPSRFAHLFRQETGLPPGQFVIQQRLLRAR